MNDNQDIYAYVAYITNFSSFYENYSDIRNKRITEKIIFKQYFPQLYKTSWSFRWKKTETWNILPSINLSLEIIRYYTL